MYEEQCKETCKLQSLLNEILVKEWHKCKVCKIEQYLVLELLQSLCRLIGGEIYCSALTWKYCAIGSFKYALN